MDIWAIELSWNLLWMILAMNGIYWYCSGDMLQAENNKVKIRELDHFL